MYNPVIVDVGRTNVMSVNLGYDVSADTITSQIRAEKNSSSALIATWSVSFLTDGTDGKLVLTLDNSQTVSIVATNAYMDLMRVSGGEPYSVFEEPLEVKFRGVVTK